MLQIVEDRGTVHDHIHLHVAKAASYADIEALHECALLLLLLHAVQRCRCLLLLLY